MCKCESFGILVEISNSYSEFTNNLEPISYGNWVKLMKCSKCSQLWVVEEWDKYQSIHAVKIGSELNWESFDYSSQIKEKMIENRGGLGTSRCLHVGCSNMQVKTSAYCIQHLYASGARA
ncbi:metal-binding protein [Zobellella taiwanensis]|uniref:Metal-binding protein n=1 Tax=Zobellella taiwanensis TaxID=347535 RepID=A0A2P7RDL2_9GAMM|nr:metal-binding protein [Zobellella taiwanensis]